MLQVSHILSSDGSRGMGANDDACDYETQYGTKAKALKEYDADCGRQEQNDQSEKNRCEVHRHTRVVAQQVPQIIPIIEAIKGVGDN